jgi:hypothetical protein
MKTKLDPKVDHAYRLNGVHPDARNGVGYTPRARRLLAQIIRKHKKVNDGKI